MDEKMSFQEAVHYAQEQMKKGEATIIKAKGDDYTLELLVEPKGLRMIFSSTKTLSEEEGEKFVQHIAEMMKQALDEEIELQQVEGKPGRFYGRI